MLMGPSWGARRTPSSLVTIIGRGGQSKNPRRAGAWGLVPGATGWLAQQYGHRTCKRCSKTRIDERTLLGKPGSGTRATLRAAFLAKNSLVQRSQLGGHLPVAELLGEAGAARCPESLAKRWIGGELFDGRGEAIYHDAVKINQYRGIWVGYVAKQFAMVEQYARLAGDHDLAGSVDVVADHRLAGDERLRQDSGEPFAETRVHDDVHRAQERRNL